MATAIPITAGHSPEPPPPASINPKAAAVLADLRTPLVRHDRSLAWLTRNICSICEEKTPLWWWIAFVPSVVMMAICFACFGYLILTGRRRLGREHAGRLGVGHHELRVLDRHRPRRAR